METIPEVVLYLASSAALIYAVTQVVSLVIAMRQPKVVHRAAIRRQVHNTYLDLDFNILNTDSFEDAVKKTVNAIDMSGLAFEKVKSDFEAEQERKRSEVAGPYQDPPKTEKSKPHGKKNKRR